MKNNILKKRANFSLSEKIIITRARVTEWYQTWDGMVYVAFSGGKDSTVLLNIVRELFPEVPAVFVDTGLEFPEIRKFVKEIDNVVWLKPKIPFSVVIKKYGYPVVSKKISQCIKEVKNAKGDTPLKRLRLTGIRPNGKFSAMSKISNKWQYLTGAPFLISDHCCRALKKSPLEKYEKNTGRLPFIGTMANDSQQRKSTYLKHGCNMFGLKRPKSTPLGFWLERDIWEFLNSFKIPYSSIYDMGYDRTGCMFCMFGLHMEKHENRFQMMFKTHRRQWEYCIKNLGCGMVLDYMGVEYGEYNQLTFDDYLRESE